MDEQLQGQFIEWLAAQLGISTQEELEAALTELGDEGVQEAFAQFQQQMQTEAFREGGKLDYVKRLQMYRKGAKVKGKIREGDKDCKTAVGLNKLSKKKDTGSKPTKRVGENRKQWITAKN